MASLTLANSPASDRPFSDHLIEELIETVKNVEQPKPPQPVPVDDPREKNAAMLIALWHQGEHMATQAFELSRKPDPLTIALNGFPDVYTSLAYQMGR